MKADILFYIILVLLLVSFIFSNKFLGKNTSLYWILIVLSILVGCKRGFLVGLLFFIIVYALHEVLYYSYNIRFLDDNERVATSYSWFDKYRNNESECGDLTEGYFKNKYNYITIEEATNNKYEKIYKLLGLKPGMKLLDIGNGYCNWALFLKKRGIKVVGITLSEEQRRYCLKNGIESHIINVVNLPKLKEGFDAVTALGSFEHFAKPLHKRGSQYELYTRILDNLKNNINPQSTCKKIFITCLHNNNENYKYNLSDYWQCYLMERHYSGNYPKINNQYKSDIVDIGLNKCNLKVKYISDKTEDYRWVSILSDKHFGNLKIDWNIDRIKYVPYMILTDPYWLQKWGYYLNKTWMWQLGGVSKKPLKNKNRPAILYWILFQVQ